MSQSSRNKAHKGQQAAAGACGHPTKAQVEATRSRLIQAQPGWTIARCRQRALVEVYLQKGSAAQ